MSAAPIRRPSATDRAMLAMGAAGDVPEQFGVLLVLESAQSLTLDRLRLVLEERTRSIPALRSRLRRVPAGGGGPIWIDDPAFDIRRQVRAVSIPDDAGDEGLYAVALAAVMAPLALSAPLWSAVLVPGLTGGRAGLVIVLHHVLTDGLGGLALLGALVDPGPSTTEPWAAAPAPPWRALAAEVWSRRWRSVRGIRHGWAEVHRSMAAGGGWRPSAATPCSLLRRTGPRRRMAVVTADLARIGAFAHRQGATSNDAVLLAIGAALSRVLASRGEAVDPLLVVVPVSGRGGPGAAEQGNLVAPLLVPVPTVGAPLERLATLAAYVRSQKAQAAGPPPIATLGWLFRPLAGLGGFRWYMNHQRRLHTLVTTVRGPRTRVSFGGSPVTGVVPISVGENGNVTAHFSVMSYAGTLTVTPIVDPDGFPDLDILRTALHEELGHLS